MKVIDGDLDLSEFLRPGDRIVLGHACGEPVTLAEALLAQAASIGGLSAFIATSFSGLFTPEATGRPRGTEHGRDRRAAHADPGAPARRDPVPSSARSAP